MFKHAKINSIVKPYSVVFSMLFDLFALSFNPAQLQTESSGKENPHLSVGLVSPINYRIHHQQPVAVDKNDKGSKLNLPKRYGDTWWYD